jgi:hypothetical protein
MTLIVNRSQVDSPDSFHVCRQLWWHYVNMAGKREIIRYNPPTDHPLLIGFSARPRVYSAIHLLATNDHLQMKMLSHRLTDVPSIACSPISGLGTESSDRKVQTASEIHALLTPLCVSQWRPQ